MAKIYVKEWMLSSDKDFYNWYNCEEIPFVEFSIKESDYENRTASFTSSHNIQIGGSSFAVKITDETMPTFTGIILSKEKTPHETFEYKCQDWNRLYMNKPTMNDVTKETYKLIKDILKYSEFNTANVYKGLLSKNKYEQREYGSTISFNPMKNKKPIGGSDKTQKEWIEYLVYSQHPYVRIHYDQVGTMLFTPYYFNDWLKPLATFHYTDLVDFDWTFDLTDIQTGVWVNNKYMTIADLFNSNNNPLHRQIYANVSYNDDVDNNTNKNSKKDTKNSKTNNKTNNPYKTKKKEVWVSMDNWQGGSTDRNYLNKVCKELKKNGWKVHKIGIGPQTHDENHISSSGAKNGVWLMLYGGVDVGCIRETCFDTSFKNICLKRNLRPVIGFNSTADIRKGGNGFKRIRKAWDDNYSSGDTSMKYPGACMAQCGVPWVQVPGNHPVKLAKIFCSGGDSKIALTKKYKRNGHGYYANFNWGSKY